MSAALRCVVLLLAFSLFAGAAAAAETRWLAGAALLSALRSGGYAEVKVLLARRIPSGTNLAIVSHRDQFAALVSGPSLDEGKAAVIEPLGEAGFRLVVRIREDEWAALK